MLVYLRVCWCTRANALSSFFDGCCCSLSLVFLLASYVLFECFALHSHTDVVSHRSLFVSLVHRRTDQKHRMCNMCVFTCGAAMRSRALSSFTVCKLRSWCYCCCCCVLPAAVTRAKLCDVESVFHTDTHTLALAQNTSTTSSSSSACACPLTHSALLRTKNTYTELLRALCVHTSS